MRLLSWEIRPDGIQMVVLDGDAFAHEMLIGNDVFGLMATLFNTNRITTLARVINDTREELEK
jgi:hypothetical protein